MDALRQNSPVRLPFYKDWLLVPLVGLVYVLDQLTKHWVESSLCPYRSIPDDGPFRLTCSYNTGSAFGLFPDQTILLILASLVGVGVLLFVYRSHPFPGFLLRISLGLQLGGAVGNLTDRLRFGQVTDFVQLGFWPVFNLADASIVVGVGLLVWIFMFSGQGAKSSLVEGAQEPQALETTGVVHQGEAPGEEDGQ